MTTIDDILLDLTEDQKSAVTHIGKHARLLAGPGTGKTQVITRRILALVLLHDVPPDQILILTFTRLAARQLRDDANLVLKPLGIDLPEISTLHSFALKQLLKNSDSVASLPKPLRIANEWEERHIIQEDLKRALGVANVKDVRNMLLKLSADWQTLTIEESGWEDEFPNAAFIGAWRKHRETYGITLRAELVYQLKKALTNSGNFELTQSYKHVIIDEFQDLNQCDLSVVYELARRAAELFVAGDDDQSIYGFRFADPIGIRQFPIIFPNTEKLVLETCFRCDKKIFHYAEFVASLDPKRLPKKTHPREEAHDGEISLLRCRNQNQEATWVASKVKELVEGGTKLSRIVILLRGDRYHIFSDPIVTALSKRNIPSALPVESELLDSDEYQIVLSYLRLLINPNDSLAFRSILQVSKNRIGEECIATINDIAASENCSFKQAADLINSRPTLGGKHAAKIQQEIANIQTKTAECADIHDIKSLLECVVSSNVTDEGIKQKITSHFMNMAKDQELIEVKDLLPVIFSFSEQVEQDVPSNVVSILTMHQAKGLTFDVAFIVGVENERIPGRSAGENEGDERRLLYVSMTRAKHALYMTYCDKRTGQQSYTGSTAGNNKRTLTKFLSDSNLPIQVVE